MIGLAQTNSILPLRPFRTGEHGLCSFVLDDRVFALDVDLVLEAITIESILPLPRSPHFVLGLFSLRGTPVPVVDLSRALEFGTMKTKPSPVVLVLKSGDLLAAFPVDRMGDVFLPDRGTILPANKDEHPAVSCFFSVTEAGSPRVITVLDSHYLLERLQGRSL
jgi:purine-binding chemotaxis protein CheW